MENVSSAAMVGLCGGFLWGIGGSLAVLYSIYLAGYKKSIKDSFAEEKPQRFVRIYKKQLAKRSRVAEAAR